MKIPFVLSCLVMVLVHVASSDATTCNNQVSFKTSNFRPGPAGTQSNLSWAGKNGATGVAAVPNRNLKQS